MFCDCLRVPRVPSCGHGSFRHQSTRVKHGPGASGYCRHVSWRGGARAVPVRSATRFHGASCNSLAAASRDGSRSGGSIQHLSRGWRRKREVTCYGRCAVRGLGQSIPAEAKTRASLVRRSPLSSMVPLERDESIGEVVALGGSHYPVWKTALMKLRRPLGIERKTTQTCNHIYPAMKSRSRCPQRNPQSKAHSVKGLIQPAATLPVVHAHAAGVDIGATEHFVCVPEDAAGPGQSPVRSFGAFTGELDKLVEWLQACKVKTVAMESTGVDSAVSEARSRRSGGCAGQRAPSAAGPRAQNRCQRLPVAAAPAQLWDA